jgi:hypothetical protein
MSRNQSFVRKVIYIAAIAALLLPLSALSQPATTGPKNQPELTSRGGKLSQLRAKYRLAQAELGEIDPASETMKLATLGLRGVAVNILWGYADHYKKVKDWDKVELTVQQIIRLQPNYLKVWDFQAHNLSYNISAEFDDYKMRYRWVKEGIAFLITGTHYNEEEPGLLSEVGWFTGQKIGRSDERRQFRRMFREDRDFHQLFRDNGVEVDNAIGADGKTPDNWLASRLWYDRAVDSAAAGRQIRGMSELLFYGRSPMSQINGAGAMHDDGYFFQRAQVAWQQASQAWARYGDREVPHSFGFNIRLNQMEEVDRNIATLYERIDKIAPTLREELRQEKIAALPSELQAPFKKPAAERTPTDESMIEGLYYQTRVSAREIASRAPANVAAQIRRLTEQIEEEERVRQAINGDRQVVAYDYWKTRCEAENMKQAPQAHKNIYDADRLGAKGEQLKEARELYEQGFELWAQIYKRHPGLMENSESRDLIQSVGRYQLLLDQLDEPFPRDFALTPLLELHEDGRRLLDRVKLLQRNESPSGQPTEETPADSSKPAEDKPAEEKPAEEKPAEEKPAEDKPTEEKSAEEKPAEDKPAEDKPAEDKPAEDKPAEEKPAEDKPTEEKSAEEKPAEDKPAEEKSAEDKLGESARNDTEPSAREGAF